MILQNSGNKVFHANTHALKESLPIIYDAYSSAGTKLKPASVPPEDYNNYIHTKTPDLRGTQKFIRDENYSEERENKNQGVQEESHDILKRKRFK